jgi:hypothetical protein
MWESLKKFILRALPDPEEEFMRGVNFAIDMIETQGFHPEVIAELESYTWEAYDFGTVSDFDHGIKHLTSLVTSGEICLLSQRP